MVNICLVCLYVRTLYRLSYILCTCIEIGWKWRKLSRFEKGKKKVPQSRRSQSLTPRGKKVGRQNHQTQNKQTHEKDTHTSFIFPKLCNRIYRITTYASCQFDYYWDFQRREYFNKTQKVLPLETKNTQNHENRRLGLTESLHMQHYSLRGCIRPLALA